MDHLLGSLSERFHFSGSMANGTTPAVSPPLYSAADLENLSTLEGWWAWYFMRIGDPVIATGLLVFLLHEVVYFGRALPWVIIDAIPYFRKWKIQPTKIPTAAQQWHCAKLVLFSHFCIELPFMGGFHGVTSFFGLKTHQVPFPHWTQMAWQIAVFFFVEDTVHYFAHRWLHTPMMYKRIHKVHHEYPAPFGLTAEYAHPLEVLILGIGTVGSPILLCAITGELHLVTVALWMTLRLFQAINAHSGYDFPWSLRHILPFWAGAEHHDFHHKAFINNFSSSFRHWDSLFGTDTKYKAYRARIAASLAAVAASTSSTSTATAEEILAREDAREEREGEEAARKVLERADQGRKAKVA